MEKIFEKLRALIYQNDHEALKKHLPQLDDLSFNYGDGRSLIFYAVLEKDSRSVELLIEKKVDLNLKDKEGWTPLHYAVDQHSVSITKILIANGAKVNAKDSYGNSVISRAVFASKGRGEIIKLLLKNGADPNLTNESCVSAKELAMTIGNYDIIQFFK